MSVISHAIPAGRDARGRDVGLALTVIAAVALLSGSGHRGVWLAFPSLLVPLAALAVSAHVPTRRGGAVCVILGFAGLLVGESGQAPHWTDAPALAAIGLVALVAGTFIDLTLASRGSLADASAGLRLASEVELPAPIEEIVYEPTTPAPTIEPAAAAVVPARPVLSAAEMHALLVRRRTAAKLADKRRA